MFGSMPTVFVITVRWNNKKWYLAEIEDYDLGHTTRFWTKRLKNAWHFKNRTDPEKLAELLFDKKIHYEVEAFTSWSLR